MKADISRKRSQTASTLISSAVVLTLIALPLHAGLTIVDLGKNYTADPLVTPQGLSQHIARDNDVIGGNTSVRNVDEAGLKWKGNSSNNGYGYYQRNRDLGQVFNVPEGESITIDAIVIRTARGNNAIMEGAPGARMYVQFFEVGVIDGETIRINENGTTVGEQATHGFDLSLNRCDDYIEGASYHAIGRATGGIFPDVSPTTQYVYNTGSGPYGEQEGHLRFFRFDLTGSDELVLEGGKRYAFMVGFDEPAGNRGIGLAITTEVHTREAAEFVSDANGVVRWGIRREGDGTLPPTMTNTPTPPEDQTLRAQLISESMFVPEHWNTLAPTSDGYPDVDTYRTLQFYIETKPAPTPVDTPTKRRSAAPATQGRTAGFNAAGRIVNQPGPGLHFRLSLPRGAK